MKLRHIPYGYAVQNGKTILHPDESITVQKIFADYINGKSLLKIAQALTDEGSEFLPGRSDWNKNRVKRIIEDKRYLGNHTYPAVIDDELFNQAQSVKDSNKSYSSDNIIPFRLSCPVLCGICDSKMVRRHDSRRKTSADVWTCKNPSCKMMVNINNSDLLAGITEILNRLIANPDFIQQKVPEETTPSMEVRRMANEAGQMMDSAGVDKTELKAKLLDLAAQRYKEIDSTPYITQMLRAAFEQSELLSSFDQGLFGQAVRQVSLSGAGQISLTLKNSQIMEKGESHHAICDNLDHAAAPACHAGGEKGHHQTGQA